MRHRARGYGVVLAVAQECAYGSKDFDEPASSRRQRRQSSLSQTMMARVFQRPAFEQWARERLVDEALERYLDWRLECAAVDEAYGAWSRASGGESALPFAAYGAALDREQRAAAAYGSVIERVARLLGDEPEAAAQQLGASRL